MFYGKLSGVSEKVAWVVSVVLDGIVLTPQKNG